MDMLNFKATNQQKGEIEKIIYIYILIQTTLLKMFRIDVVISLEKFTCQKHRTQPASLCIIMLCSYTLYIILSFTRNLLGLTPTHAFGVALNKYIQSFKRDTP